MAATMAKPSGIKPYTGSNRCGSPSLQSLEAALAELSAEQLEAAQQSECI